MASFIVVASFLSEASLRMRIAATTTEYRSSAPGNALERIE